MSVWLRRVLNSMPGLLKYSWLVWLDRYVLAHSLQLMLELTFVPVGLLVVRTGGCLLVTYTHFALSRTVREGNRVCVVLSGKLKTSSKLYVQ